MLKVTVEGAVTASVNVTCEWPSSYGRGKVRVTGSVSRFEALLELALLPENLRSCYCNDEVESEEAILLLYQF